MRKAKTWFLIVLTIIAVTLLATACDDKGGDKGGGSSGGNNNVVDPGGDEGNENNEKYAETYNYALKILNVYENSRIIIIPAEKKYLSEMDLDNVDGLTELIYALIPARNTDSTASVLKAKALYFSNDSTAQAYFDELDSEYKLMLGNKVFLNFSDDARTLIDAAAPISVADNVTNYTNVLMNNGFFVSLSKDSMIAQTNCTFMLGGGKSAIALGSIINSSSIPEFTDLSYNVAVNFYTDNASALAALDLFDELTLDEEKNAYYDEDAPNGMNKIYFKVTENMFYQCRYDVYNALRNGGFITSPELNEYTEIFEDFESKEIDHIGIEDFNDTYYWGDDLSDYPVTLLLYFKDKTYYRLKYIPQKGAQVASSAAELSEEISSVEWSEEISYIENPITIRPNLPPVIFEPTPRYLGNEIYYLWFNSEPSEGYGEGTVTFYYKDHSVNANYTILSDIVDYEIKGLRTEYLPNEMLLLYWQDIELSYTLRSGNTVTIKPCEYDTYNLLDAIRPVPDLKRNIVRKIYQDDSELTDILPSSGNFKIEMYLRGKTISVDCRINRNLAANFNFADDIWQYDDFLKLNNTYYDHTITINFSDNTKGAFVIRDNFSFEPNTSLAGNYSADAVYNDYSFNLNYTVKPQDASVKNFEFYESGNGARVEKYKGINPNVVIPSTYRGKKVYSISSAIFNNNDTAILSLSIPDFVTDISIYRYEKIFDSRSLISIFVDENNPAFSSENGILFDKEKTKILSVPTALPGEITIPNSVKSIENYAFSGCSGLTSIVIPDSVTSIGDHAFSGCSGLTSIMIPNSVTSIGSSAFSRCSGLTSIVIPDSVTSIGNHAFYDCSGLTSIVIPDSVTSIGSYAFSGCSGLTSIMIPESVTSIGDSAFYRCGNLSSIVIPEGMISIGSSAFYNCGNLNSIFIPDSVTSIGDSAFYGCNGLSSITVGENNKSYISQDGILYNKAKTQILIVPKSISGAIVLPDSLTSIENSAFSGCSELTSITIPSSVTSIGDSAFYNCKGLMSITIPDSVATIGERTFAYNYSLLSAKLPDGLKNIPDGMFSDCRNLISITLPSSLERIGNEAFSGCYNLNSINLPSSLKMIGNGAFNSCSNLGSIIVPDSVTYIGNEAFYSCYNLSSIKMPSSLKMIGNKAFFSCSRLGNIVIPDGVTYIGNEAFHGCSSFNRIVIPKSVDYIGGFVFDFKNTFTIICEATNKPERWDSNWNSYIYYYDYVYPPYPPSVNYEIRKHSVVWGEKN